MKSSAEKASASHTCRCSLAGTFSSDSSHEKKLAWKRSEPNVSPNVIAHSVSGTAMDKGYFRSSAIQIRPPPPSFFLPFTSTPVPLRRHFSSRPSFLSAPRSAPESPLTEAITEFTKIWNRPKSSVTYYNWSGPFSVELGQTIAIRISRHAHWRLMGTIPHKALEDRK